MPTVPLQTHTSPAAARRGVARPLAAGLGAAALAAAVAAAFLASPWILVAWLIPDVALLAGLSPDFGAQGRLAPRAVPAYNALHALPGPIALIAAGVLLPALVAPGLIWLSHVLADRALGYGLRTPDGRQRA
jgi:hypothetical protein